MMLVSSLGVWGNQEQRNLLWKMELGHTEFQMPMEALNKWFLCRSGTQERDLH